MLIRVELSGFGHYGVCTVLNRDLFFELMRVIEEFPPQIRPINWIGVNHNFPSRPVGIDTCFRIRPLDLNAPEVKLMWQPGKIADAMCSHQLLARAIDVMKAVNRSCTTTLELSSVLNLEVSINKRRDGGWSVAANLSDSMWDLIESGAFSEEFLEGINNNIRSWWEDQYNDRIREQFTSVFKGKDGPTLQVTSNGGQGLWIAGSRKLDCGLYQLSDHNTDSWRDAFGHVLSLCIVVDHCRRSKC